MFWESSGVVGFDLGPLLEGQMRTAKVLITRLLLVLEVLVHCLYGGYNLHQFSDALGLVVSTGSIRWIHWFSVRYAAAARREIFGVNALRGKQQQLGSPNLQDIFIGG